MAISLTPGMRELQDCMLGASNQKEYSYYAARLDDAMRKHSEYDPYLQLDYQRDMMRNALTTANLIGGTISTGTISNSSINTAPTPVQNIVDPLSFLKNADKKLLLTGEVA
jgi:hypothetical protein